MYSDTGEMAGVQERRTDLEEKDMIKGFPGAARPREETMARIIRNMVWSSRQAIVGLRKSAALVCGCEWGRAATGLLVIEEAGSRGSGKCSSGGAWEVGESTNGDARDLNHNRRHLRTIGKTAKSQKKERERPKEVSFNQTERLKINLSEITQALPRAMSTDQSTPTMQKNMSSKVCLGALGFNNLA